jgi:hypothetical protein
MELHRHRSSRERTRQNIELRGISQPSRGPDGLRPKGKGEWPDKGPAIGAISAKTVCIGGRTILAMRALRANFRRFKPRSAAPSNF